eukprot:CAMPEP_0179940842 /NCGR_PEP_ID=MMETSP0983-20121128/16575_1 /TAXON_ID=483367 /ORGANISM="non described non described, Strain CCMP 2436" /LENGTH=47 /DNA_ID= /DNA_START= /DNA_END= /DNA_ORIENTATION=
MAGGCVEEAASGETRTLREAKSGCNASHPPVHVVASKSRVATRIVLI